MFNSGYKKAAIKELNKANDDYVKIYVVDFAWVYRRGRFWYFYRVFLRSQDVLY